MVNNRVHIDLSVSSGNSSGSDNWFYRDIKDIQKLPKAFSEVEEIAWLRTRAARVSLTADKVYRGADFSHNHCLIIL